MLSPPEFKASREAAILRDLFLSRSREKPAIVTWQEMVEQTGKTKAEVSSLMPGAKTHLLKHHGQVWASDRSIGYRLVTDSEMSRVLQGDRKRGYRLDRRSLEKSDCADPTKMSNEERTKYHLERTVLAMRRDCSKPRTLSNLEQTMLRKGNELPTAEEMVEAIRESLRK